MDTINIDIGESVACDMCNEDFSNSEESGGFLFSSNAVCPHCEVRIRENACRYNETHLIKAECPASLSFKAWILQLRNGNNNVKIISV